MSYRLAGFLFLCAVLILGASCTKVGEPPQGSHTISVQALSRPDSVPSNWGKLISTSSCPEAKEWIQLWFQDDAGVIRMLAYNVQNNTLGDKAIVFHRD